MALEHPNEHEPLFRDLLDAAPDPIVIVNEAGAIVHVNSRVEEVLGYERRELLGERVEVLIPDRFALAHRVHRGDYIAAPSARPMGSGLELWALRKDGTEIPVEISLAPLETPNGTLVSAALRDVGARRIAEQKTRELAAILDSSSDAVIGWSLDGTVTTWNRGAERIYGYAAEEMVGRGHDLLLPPGARPDLPEILRTVRAGGRVDNVEGERVRKDGRVIHVALSAAPILDSAGDVVGVSTSARDISEQRHARRRLAESARHFELIQDLVATCGYDGYFKVVNGAWEQVLGWSDDQLLPNPFIEIVHPDDRDAVDREVAKVAAGGITADFKIRVATSDGRWLWTEWSAVPDPDPERALFHASGREISGRMEAEQALASERRQFADAQQMAKVGSWELDPGNGERRWSEQQFRNHGFDPSRPPPSPAELIEAIHPDDRDEVRTLLEEVERDPRSFEHSYRVVLANGTIREIAVEGRPFIAADESVRMIGTSRDVTAERAAERLKDEFFQLVSHELRTPLTSIVGYAELLAEIEAENLSPEGRRFVEVIDRNSKRELNLVGDLLMLTRITAGTFEIELGEADLGEIARATAEAMGPDAAHAGVEVALDLDRAPVIAGDPHRLRQVVENLVSNAIKFTPRGGSVTIKATADGELAEIAVADTGIGIPPEDRGRLFERMYRAPEAERRHIQGTGLGLTIVKAIVDAHGGTITVDSDVDEGATFRVKLPVAEGARTDRRARPRGRPDRRRASRRRVGGG
jgi:PAS domain S-box-containing protein